MIDSLDTYTSFTKGVLVPRASGLLQAKYEAYCAGDDIGVEAKADSSPASDADRETEEVLRNLIEKEYPNHGICGEEYGASRTDRDYVWVLDPLDGTREFLAKARGCFGVLIALLYQGKPILGTIHDPIHKQDWFGSKDMLVQTEAPKKSLKDSIVTCTNSERMFVKSEQQEAIQTIQNKAKGFQQRMNCIGFAKVADGIYDAVIESDLSLHDIAALIPVLSSAGKTVIDFDGEPYAEKCFEISVESPQKYNVIAASSDGLAREILTIMQGQEAA